MVGPKGRDRRRRLQALAERAAAPTSQRGGTKRPTGTKPADRSDHGRNEATCSCLTAGRTEPLPSSWARDRLRERRGSFELRRNAVQQIFSPFHVRVVQTRSRCRAGPAARQRRADRRQVPAGRDARARRNGGGVRRPSRAAAATGGHQIPHPGRDRRQHGHRALFQRGPRHGAHPERSRVPGPRFRLAPVGEPLSGDGEAGGERPGPSHRQPRAAAHPRGGGPRAGGAGGDSPRPTPWGSSTEI
jgi:hypothetical protein